MNESKVIELICELSQNRIKDTLINDAEIYNYKLGKYTEKAQNLFNNYYDYYEGIILDKLSD